MYNLFYNLSQAEAISLPPTQLGLNKIQSGMSFLKDEGQPIKPVQFLVDKKVLRISNSVKKRKDSIDINIIRDSFLNIPVELLESSKKNPILWILADQVALPKNVPCYVKLAVWGDKILIGVISGYIKARNNEGKEINWGRAYQCQPEDLTFKEYHAEDIKQMVNRKDRNTGQYFFDECIVDISILIEEDKDKNIETTTRISPMHCIYYDQIRVLKIQHKVKNTKTETKEENVGDLDTALEEDEGIWDDDNVESIDYDFIRMNDTVDEEEDWN